LKTDAKSSPPTLLGPQAQPGALDHERAPRDLAWLIHSIDGIVWEARPDTLEFLFVSRQAERLLGYPLEQWYSPNFWVHHLHPEDRDWAPAFCQNETIAGRSHDIEYRMIAADQRVVWLRDIATVTNDDPFRLQGIMVDITAQRQAEAALRESYQQVQELARSLMTAKEAERTRIARELHDGVNQQLAVAASGLKGLQLSVPAALRHEVRRWGRALDQAIATIRDLSHELHPAVLQHSGLIAALRAQCTEFSRRFGIKASVSAEGLAEIRGELAVGLFRMVQEALHNVAQHAHATSVVIQLERGEDRLQLTIRDDGRGFAAAQSSPSGGLGLISIGERARLLSGSLELQSSPGAGTSLIVQVPFSWNG
jgi:PAS domain S-box-containing protein